MPGERASGPAARVAGGRDTRHREAGAITRKTAARATISTFRSSCRGGRTGDNSTVRSTQDAPRSSTTISCDELGTNPSHTAPTCDIGLIRVYRMSELGTSQKGAAAEAEIAAAAIRLDLVVLRPLGDGGRYDLAIDTRPRLLRVQ